MEEEELTMLNYLLFKASWKTNGNSIFIHYGRMSELHVYTAYKVIDF